MVTGSMIRAVHISKIFVSQITRSATTIFGSYNNNCASSSLEWKKYLFLKKKVERFFSSSEFEYVCNSNINAVMPEPGGPGEPLAPPIFGRSVNPIPTGEGRLFPPITAGTPNVFHLPASLNPSAAPNPTAALN